MISTNDVVTVETHDGLDEATWKQFQQDQQVCYGSHADTCILCTGYMYLHAYIYLPLTLSSSLKCAGHTMERPSEGRLLGRRGQQP